MSVSVCVLLFVCLSAREHISGTTPPRLTELFYARPCLVLWRRCDTLFFRFAQNGVTGRVDHGGMLMPLQRLMSLRLCTQAHTHAASHWLRRFLDDGGARLDVLSILQLIRGVGRRGRSLQCTIASIKTQLNELLRTSMSTSI